MIVDTLLLSRALQNSIGTGILINGDDVSTEELFSANVKKLVIVDGEVVEQPIGISLAQALEQLENFKATEVLEELRRVRNAMLASTDWWVLPDRTPTQAQLDYRQALRDITNTYTSLDDVVWPEKP